MTDLSPERREELAQTILDDHRARLGFDPIPLADCAGPDDYTRPVEAIAPLIAAWLDDTYRRALADAYPLAAAEREIGAAEVRARVEAVLRQWHLDGRLNSHPLAAEVRAALNGGPQ